MKSTAPTLQAYVSADLTKSPKNYRKCWNLRFCPKGPPDSRAGGECFAPLDICFCAAARKITLGRRIKPPRTVPEPQKLKILTIFRNPESDVEPILLVTS